MDNGNQKEYMRKSSISLILEQLKMRGENAIFAKKFDRHEIVIKDKDIKIKVKFSKPVQRSKCRDSRWEFTKLVHRSRLWPMDTIDFYILVGFGTNGDIRKMWKISVDDKIIYRKNQIFIPVDKTEDYDNFELKIIDGHNPGLKWID